MSPKKMRYEPPVAFDVNYADAEVASAQACTSGSNPAHAQCKYGSMADNLCKGGGLAGGRCGEGGTAGGGCKQGQMA